MGWKSLLFIVMALGLWQPLDRMMYDTPAAFNQAVLAFMQKHSVSILRSLTKTEDPTATALGLAEQQTREAEQQIRKPEEERRQAAPVLSEEQLILALEDQKRALRGKGGEKFNADDYVAVNASGQVFDKAQGSDLYNSGKIKIESEEITDTKVRIFPETALVTDIWRYKAVREGQERTGVLREARLWAKRQGKWQSVFWQATPIVQANKTDQPLANPQRTDAEIRRSENEWVQLSLHNDGAGMGRLLADEFTSIRTDGAVRSKTDRMNAFSPGSVQTEVLEISDMRIRRHEDTALVTGLATRKDTVDGKARDFQYRYTRVWILRDGRWQCVHMQSTTIGPLGGLSK